QRAQGVGGPRGSSAKDLISSRACERRLGSNSALPHPPRHSRYALSGHNGSTRSQLIFMAFWSFRPVHGTHLERVLRVESTLRGSDAPRTPARPRCRSELDLL